MTGEDKRKVLELLEGMMEGTSGVERATMEECKQAIGQMQEYDGYIPVTERLPEIGRKCLITNGETIKIGWIRPDGVWKTGVRHNDLWGRFSLYPPTHWMPLPEPPKEGAR